MIRDKKLKLSLGANLMIKSLSILVNFALVPLLLSLLGKEKYGIWLTLYAIVGWLVMFDLGLGNGLKLKLTQAFSNKRYHEAKELISTAYILIGSISLILSFLFFVSTYVLNYNYLFQLSDNNNYDISITISILAFSFFIILTLKLISDIFSSLQLSFIDDLIKLISQFIFLGFIFYYTKYNFNFSLSNASIFATFPLIIIYFTLSFYFFFIKVPALKISINSYSKILANNITTPGISFFLIQICSIILYSTDNLLIAKLISPSAVTNYNISYKFFGLPFLVFGLFISTHWMSFIDAIAKDDEIWIRKKINLFKLLFIILVLVYLISYFLYDKIVPLWIRNDEVKTDYLLNKAIIIYYLISSFTTIYIYVVNAYGKITLQKYLYIIIAFVNVPLSIFLVKLFNLGSAGVIIASSICLLLLLAFIPIQSTKLLNKTAKGLWNK